jgi:hypothetical protein
MLKIATFHCNNLGAAQHINAAIFDSIAFTRADLVTSWRSSCVMMLPLWRRGDVRGHLSISLSTPFLSLTILYLPLYICTILSHLHHLQCITSKSTTFIFTKFNNNHQLMPSHTPYCIRHIGTYPHDPMVSPRVMPIPIFRRLDTRRLGTGSFSISSVDWPSQGSLECSFWISIGQASVVHYLLLFIYLLCISLG